MESFIPYVQEYGYWVLIIGALIEGESILLLAGGAAYFGYFSLPMVMIVSFVGALIHDQLLYTIGRIGGNSLINKSIFWQKKADRAFTLLKKYDYWLIMGFRFIYGIRTITPIVVGASNLDFKRYTSLTFISAAIWAVVISAVGYLFATILESLIKAFHEYQIYLAIGLGILILGGFGIYKYRKYKIEKKASPSIEKSSNLSSKRRSHHG